MKKEILETFIKRYNLSGEISKVKWKYSVDDKTLHTRASANNRNFMVDVILNNFTDFGNDNLTICIGDTDKVKRMMSPFGDDIKLSINLNPLGDKVIGFTISDDDCESYCTAADPSSIEPTAKTIRDIPDCHIVIPLTEDFLDKFLKARMALKEVTTFSVGMNKKGVFEIVFGYTTMNSNRIRLTPTCEPDKDKLQCSSISFPVTNIAEALKANQDINDGKLLISSLGVLQVYFKNDDYTCNYFQFANKK